MLRMRASDADVDQRVGTGHVAATASATPRLKPASRGCCSTVTAGRMAQPQSRRLTRSGSLLCHQILSTYAPNRVDSSRGLDAAGLNRRRAHPPTAHDVWLGCTSPSDTIHYPTVCESTCASACTICMSRWWVRRSPSRPPAPAAARSSGSRGRFIAVVKKKDLVDLTELIDAGASGIPPADTPTTDGRQETGPPCALGSHRARTRTLIRLRGVRAALCSVRPGRAAQGASTSPVVRTV